MTAQYQQTVSALNGLGDDAFLQRAYSTLLGRAPDPIGLRDYLARLRAGVQRAQVWGELACSEEARRFASKPIARPNTAAAPKATLPSSLLQLLQLDGSEFLQQAYRVVLGREADPTGLRDRLQVLDAGGSKSQILADLRCDPEGLAYASSFSGLDDWIKLVQQQASVWDLLALNGEMFLIGAYVALFRREPDVHGFQRYLELMQSGASRTFVLMELFNSPEAREKAAAVRGLPKAIAQYKKAQRKSWGGWYGRNVLGVESDLPADRERRALVYRCVAV